MTWTTRIAALAAAAALAACSGDDPGNTDAIIPPPPPDTDTDVIEDTGTTEEEGGYIDGAYFSLLGEFGFDAATDEFVPWAHPDLGPQPIRFAVSIHDTRFLETLVADAENTCTIVLEVDQRLPIAAWTETEGIWAGLDIPGSATIDDGCAAYRFPGEWEGDPVGAVSKWTYGVGITVLDEYTEDFLRENLPASEWAAAEPYIVGGVLKSNLFVAGGAPETLADQAAFGYEVDGNFEVEVGGTGNYVPILKEDVETATAIATGFYEVQSAPFSPGNLLTQTPL